jgi:SPP1 gp7 family putative phage head morphogenesis protein
VWRGRVKNIFENNIAAAYQAGKWEQYQRVKEERPYLQYVAIRDNRTRPDHAMIDGTVRPIDDSFWQFYYPPNGYRCRCTTISLSAYQMEREGLEVTPDDASWTLRGKDGDVAVRIGDTYEWKNPRGEVEKIPVGVAPGFNFSPGQYVDALNKQLDEKLAIISKP